MRIKVDVKARWSEEETLMMAKKEAELFILNPNRFMNQDLAGIFQNRSLEAIKRVRRKDTYKEAVRNFLDELEAGPSNRRTPMASPTGSPISEETNDPSSTDANLLFVDQGTHFLEFILAQPPPRVTSYNSQDLVYVIDQAQAAGKGVTLACLTAYFLEIWPSMSSNSAARPMGSEEGRPRTRRQLRRKEYALTQRNWDKHQGRCIKSILEEPNDAVLPPKEVMVAYWRNVMEQDCALAPPEASLKQLLNSTWAPITCEEIKQCQLDLSSSPGPDGITPRQLRAIPRELLMRILNLILWCGKLPLPLRRAKTIFLPKGNQPTDPGGFRPITIPSVVTRLLHSILAKRISNAIKLDPRQRAFQPTDGCADNTTLVDLLLRDHHSRYASCYLASLDVSKAFDSVSHRALFNTLRSFGFPDGLINYLENCYQSSSTYLVGPGWISPEIHPKRGVKQGDPMSPIIFNLIIDRLLKSLPNNIGCYIGTSKINALAFADDLLLCATTPQGLQTLIDITHAFLSSCGMSLNSSKCLSIGIKGQAKDKNTVVEQRTFNIAGRAMPALKRSEEWKYLGISFTADGKCKYKAFEELLPKLDRLTKAPLKPQQRLHALRTVAIPQLYHKLTLGNIMIGSLNTTDKMIRKFVRKWLDLPKDAPNAFFHAPVANGGLGIPSLRWNAPLLRKSRLLNLQLPNLEATTVANTFIANEIDRAEKRLTIQGRRLENSEDVDEYWSAKLYETADGFGLREARRHRQAHRWIREPTRLLSGRDFIQCIKLRINALPSRSRTTRGRQSEDRFCRAGCLEPETTNHIVQKCLRTNAARIERHNSVVKFIQRSLNNKGYTTIEEPRFHTTPGLRKPDLLALSGNKAILVDAQVVTDGRSLDEAHSRKFQYYNTEEIRSEIRRRYSVTEIKVTTATLNWRGIWSGESVNQLLSNEIISSRDTALISTRVSIGTIRCFRIFNTSVSNRRGIG